MFQWTKPDTIVYTISASEIDSYASATSDSESTSVAGFTENGTFEYKFNYNFGFYSKAQGAYGCFTDECYVAIREHSVYLRIIQTVNTEVNDLFFIVENKKTAEECGCAFNEEIKGRALWYKDLNCDQEITELKNHFVLTENMYSGIVMNNKNMQGRIAVEGLTVHCRSKEGVSIAAFAHNILRQDNSKNSYSTCVNSVATIANQQKGKICEDCYFVMSFDVTYSRSNSAIVGEDNLFLPLRQVEADREKLTTVKETLASVIEVGDVQSESFFF